LLPILRKEEAKATILKRLPLELYPLPSQVKKKLKEVLGQELPLPEAMAKIVEEVRIKGDSAIKDFTKNFDGVEISQLEVTSEEIEAAFKEAPSELVSALRTAAERINTFHTPLKPRSLIKLRRGLGRAIHPLKRIGIYVPGGIACYPSTILMAAIPARIAGVEEIILTTPPRKDGKVPTPNLIAAHIVGVNRVFKVGGAQAIAALAWGTQSIPRVDKICGPGNIFVQLAKKQVYGVVDIDGIYGPSEVVILADDSADPSLCAADLLAQAEHDILASAILITPFPKLAEEVCQEIERQLKKLSRGEIIAQALENKGGIILVDNLQEGLELIEDYAPEHLGLMVKDAMSYLNRLHNVGAISIGSPIALTDYLAGPSHILPTGGAARFHSPLEVKDFLKVTNIIAVEERLQRKLSPIAITLARAEGLTAHAYSLEMRYGRKNPTSPA